MTMHRLLLPLLLSLILAACGGQDDSQTAPETPAAPAQQPATEPMPAPAPEPGEAAEAEAPETTEATEAIVVEDDDAEATAVVSAVEQPQWKYSTGQYYSKLPSAQGTSTGPGGVEVTEVFWYGCPHCYSFDPIITGWERKLPSDVRFVRVPVMWDPTNEIHARMYYTAEALDKLDQMHNAFFNALHREGKTLTREDDIRDFFADFGVSGEDFDKTFRSFAVESKLKRAKNLTERYRIRSVPVLVVDGKYVVDGPDVKSYDDMLAVTDELVAREQLER
jgi:thiol:disulfide interchange protein DsbA